MFRPIGAFAQTAERARLWRVRMLRLVMLAVLVVPASCSEQPKRQVWAVVVSIASHPNPKWHPEEVVVTARSPAGAFGTKTVRAKRLSCRVGDTVRATAQGIALTLDEGTCER
jgi:hypothetical protein